MRSVSVQSQPHLQQRFPLGIGENGVTGHVQGGSSGPRVDFDPDLPKAPFRKVGVFLPADQERSLGGVFHDVPPDFDRGFEMG
jgi:hypothetical protein